MKYSLDDIFIVPASESNISSRSECDPYIDGMLPLFTAPMSSVVELKNYKTFKDNKINPIIPRTVDFLDRKCMCSDVWCAFSLDEFNYFISILLYTDHKLYCLIDIANGHMKVLHDSIREAKSKFGDDIVIMAGNIANPETYSILSEAGADYVRVGIGSGSVCSTSNNTGIYYPNASLISECFNESLHLDRAAQIVADGGVKRYSDIIKCFALGADYVMCGSVFNKMLESAGLTTNNSGVVVNQYDLSVREYFEDGNSLYKNHYGMSTNKAQEEINNSVNRISEGIEKTQEVEYTMSEWTENFIAYLKSAMSYTSSHNILEFIGQVKTIEVSENSAASIRK
jgi:IMP dehydrogenase/GMP reductase